MEILYLSSMCSLNEYERMFKLYGSTSSHASQKFNRLFVKGLIDNGYSVEALSQRIILEGGENDLTRPRECENGITYTYLKRYKNKYINRLMNILNTIIFLWKWSKKHPDGNIVCDTILGEMSIAVWVTSRLKKINTTALVTDVPSIRGINDLKGLKSLPSKIKNDCILSYKSYVFLTQQMNDILNKKDKPYVVIEGLVDPNIANTHTIDKSNNEEKVVLMAGMMEAYCGVDKLVEAFKRVDIKDASLKLYGKGSYVQEIIKASKDDPRIKYCGELTNEKMIEEEKKASLLINPRSPKGEWTAYCFPSKNIEYMSSGTPLVAFNLPSIPESYLPYFYQIEEDSVDCICSTIETLLSMDSKELDEFGMKAQSWIVENKKPKTQLFCYKTITNSFKKGE